MKFNLLIIFCFYLNSTAVGQITKSDSNASLKRNFRDAPVRLIQLDSTYLADVDLFRPELFSINENNNTLFVFDYSKKNLFSVNISTPSEIQISDVTEIGNGGGSGPGEFRNPTDLCVSNTPNGERVVIIDPQLGRVSLWDAVSGSFISSFKPKKFVSYRLACTDSKIIVYNTGYIDSGNYGIYDYQGNFLSSIKDPTLGKDADSFTGSGYISSNDNLVYFAGMDNNVVKYFDLSDSEYVGKRSFVEPQELSNEAEVTKDDKTVTRKRGRNFMYQAKGSGIFDEYLIVLFSGYDHAFGNIVDFYDKKNLSYKFSIKLEDACSKMVVKNNILVLKAYDYKRKDTQLKFYEIVRN